MGGILIKSQIWPLGTLNEFGEGEVDALRLSCCKLGPRGHCGEAMGSREIFTLHSLFTFINLLSFFFPCPCRGTVITVSISSRGRG